MAKGYKHGAGGANPLNFKVVGNPQPATPRENTIWVNTDVKISSWIFSSTEPAAPDEGMVWFLSGTSSTSQFNALKKNGIQVYPLAAKQYVSGAWVDVTAKSYQGDKWVGWAIYVYHHGYNNENLTGGWGQKGLDNGTAGTHVTPTVVFSEEEIQMSVVSSANYPCGGIYTMAKIDLTPYKEIRITAKHPGEYTHAYFSVWNDVPSSNANTNYVVDKTFGKVEEYTEFVVDVSAVNKSCVLGFWMMYANHTLYIKSIELVRK